MAKVIIWLISIGVVILFVVGITQEIKDANACADQGGRWVNTDYDSFCVKKEFLIGN